MSVIDELIFDRTQEDLNVARECKRLNIPLPSDNLKFSWDNRALNRTEQAMQYVNEIFVELGYFTNLKFKTDWSKEPITEDEANRYINNLKVLRNYLVLEVTTPTAPNTINGMTLERANDIEKILFDIDVALERLMKIFRYADDLYANEDYFN